MPDPYVLVPAGTLSGRGAGERVELPRDATHHLARVLRLRDGAGVVVADGAGMQVSAALDGSDLRLVDDPVQVPAPRPRVTVWQALGKGRKHDEVVRVLTELGVDRIVAVTSRRTQVDLTGKVDKARDRWSAVARSACEQSRRPWAPELAGPVDLATCLEELDAPCLLAHVGATHDPLAVLAHLGDLDEVVVAVGPEGGWTDDEVAAFADTDARPVGLGPTVLRTEHAATVLASVVLAGAGRMAP